MAFRVPFFAVAAGALLLAGAARAQTPTFSLAAGSVAQVVQGTDTLTAPWAGGINTAQFSPIDLDGDGQLDLYALDRITGRSLTWLSVAKAGGGRRYQFAPDYALLFPADLAFWALLRDYDCDGRPDIFTYAPGGNVRVFRNVAGAGGRPSFVLANAQLSFPVGTYISNLNIGAYNLPAIEDVNGDGRLDILTYDFIGSTLLELYLNTSTSSCGGVASFTRYSGYWAQLTACVDCGSFQLQGAPSCSTYRVEHTLGHNLLLLDLNGDGKLDMLDGRDNCTNLTRLYNSGTSSVDAAFTPADVSTAFPSAAAPVNLPVFPGAYRFDADFDGVPDLLLAPNMIDNSADHVSLRRNVQLYHNAAASASAVPSYTLTADALLQDQMLDVSEGAMAAFGDVSGDGLPDMLLGNQADRVNGYYRAALAYYLNVGTAARPVFRLQTDDYLGLGAAAQAANATFLSVRPALADLNHDGAPDLVYSAYDGTNNHLNYILNAAPAGQPASYALARASYLRPQGAAGSGVLPSRQNDTPCFVDVDGDGYLDMLLGTNDIVEPGGSLRYFRNQGAGYVSNVANAFVLADGNYGQLTAANGRPAGLCPAVADFDHDGTLDLLTSDSYGNFTFYANFRAQTGAFLGRTDLFYNSLDGSLNPAPLGHTYNVTNAVTAADLNQDGRPELYAGLNGGGVASYLPRLGSTALTAQPATAKALAFGLYPNPATQAATAETAQPTTLRVFDALGRQVLADPVAARTHQLDLRALAPGLYLTQAVAADGTTATQRLVVK